MNEKIQKLTEKYGLIIKEEIAFNDMGIDFRVGRVTDIHGQQWILRIPRRENMSTQIEAEKQILNVVKKYLSVEVPNWKIANQELIAYPLLTDLPALTFDSMTYEVSWNMDKDSPNYVPSLAKVLVELHQIPDSELMENNLKIKSSSEFRKEIEIQIKTVKSELGMSQELESRYLAWVDNEPLWPTFTKFIHGDLYAGHVLTNKNNEITGIIDWTTAHKGDIAMDFSGHVNVFGEASLKELIEQYKICGGETYDKLFEQAIERAASSALAYGYFAIETNNDHHINAAKGMLQG